MALRVKGDLWCDVCGSYPKGVQFHHPSGTHYTELYVNASGAIVLPEGWCQGEWASTLTFCSSGCEARQVELAEHRAGGRWQSQGDVKCDHCGAVQRRRHTAAAPYYLLPPGWGVVGRYYKLCGTCSPQAEVRARFPVRSEED